MVKDKANVGQHINIFLQMLKIVGIMHCFLSLLQLDIYSEEFQPIPIEEWNKEWNKFTMGKDVNGIKTYTFDS